MGPQKVLSMALLLVIIAVGCATTQTAQRSVALATGDQIKLDFDYYPAHRPNSPAVILLPDTRCDRKLFGSFPAMLNEAGFGVMAIDFKYKRAIKEIAADIKNDGQGRKEDVFIKPILPRIIMDTVRTQLDRNALKRKE